MNRAATFSMSADAHNSLPSIEYFRIDPYRQWRHYLLLCVSLGLASLCETWCSITAALTRSDPRDSHNPIRFSFTGLHFRSRPGSLAPWRTGATPHARPPTRTLLSSSRPSRPSWCPSSSRDATATTTSTRHPPPHPPPRRTARCSRSSGACLCIGTRASSSSPPAPPSGRPSTRSPAPPSSECVRCAPRACPRRSGRSFWSVSGRIGSTWSSNDGRTFCATRCFSPSSCSKSSRWCSGAARSIGCLPVRSAAFSSVPSVRIYSKIASLFACFFRNRPFLSRQSSNV